MQPSSIGIARTSHTKPLSPVFIPVLGVGINLFQDKRNVTIRASTLNDHRFNFRTMIFRRCKMVTQPNRLIFLIRTQAMAHLQVIRKAKGNLRHTSNQNSRRTTRLGFIRVNRAFSQDVTNIMTRNLPTTKVSRITINNQHRFHRTRQRHHKHRRRPTQVNHSSAKVSVINRQFKQHTKNRTNHRKGRKWGRSVRE